MKCCIKNCVDYKYKNVSLHKFPTDEILRQKWIKNINCLNKQFEQFLFEKVRVCSAHFEKECLKKQYSFSHTVLKPGSVPTLFPNMNASETFPKDESRKKQWIDAIKTPLWKPDIKKYSVICSNHFEETRELGNHVYIEPDSIPNTINESYRIIGSSTSKRDMNEYNKIRKRKEISSVNILAKVNSIPKVTPNSIICSKNFEIIQKGKHCTSYIPSISILKDIPSNVNEKYSPVDNSDDIEIEVSDKTCRICLKIFNKEKELKSVFENDDGNIKIAKKIYDVSGVFVDKNLNIPKRICKLCMKTLNVSYRFRKLCQQSDVKLRSARYKADLFIENTSENDNVDEMFLKTETDSENGQSDHEEEGEMQDDCDYRDFITISDHDYTHSKCCELQATCDCQNNKDFISCEYNREFDKSCKYEGILESATRNQSLKTVAKINKNQCLKRKSKFKEEWLKKYDFLRLNNSNKTITCIVCLCKLSFSHTGESEIVRHAKTRKHMTNIARYCELKKKTIRKASKHLNCDKIIHNCIICGNKFKTLRALRRHLKEFHPNSKSYECRICQKHFRLMIQLKHHIMKSHSKAKITSKNSEHSSEGQPDFCNEFEQECNNELEQKCDGLLELEYSNKLQIECENELRESVLESDSESVHDITC